MKTRNFKKVKFKIHQKRFQNGDLCILPTFHILSDENVSERRENLENFYFALLFLIICILGYFFLYYKVLITFIFGSFMSLIFIYRLYLKSKKNIIFFLDMEGISFPDKTSINWNEFNSVTYENYVFNFYSDDCIIRKDYEIRSIYINEFLIYIRAFKKRNENVKKSLYKKILCVKLNYNRNAIKSEYSIKNYYIY